jgi:hypothetical protein
MGARIDEHGAVVHDGVPVVANTVFGRHLVIGDPARRQHSPDPNLLLIPMGARALLNDILPKAWPLLISKAANDSAAYSANHCSHWTANDSTADRSGRRARSSPTGLRLHGKGEGEQGESGSRRNCMSSHEEVPFKGGRSEELAEAATVLRAHGQGGYFLSASKAMSAPPYGRREPGELLVCKPLAPARVPTGLLSSPWHSRELILRARSRSQTRPSCANLPKHPRERGAPPLEHFVKAAQRNASV